MGPLEIFTQPPPWSLLNLNPTSYSRYLKRERESRVQLPPGKPGPTVETRFPQGEIKGCLFLMRRQPGPVPGPEGELAVPHPCPGTGHRPLMHTEATPLCPTIPKPLPYFLFSIATPSSFRLYSRSICMSQSTFNSRPLYSSLQR